MGLANQAASQQWAAVHFVAQNVPPTLAVQRYGTENLVQGRNIQAKFSNHNHFVCGTWKGFDKFHHDQFTQIALGALELFMPEIRHMLETKTDRNGVRTYVPYVAKAARENGFKIWTALKFEEQPGATDERASSNVDGEIPTSAKKRRRMEVDITSQPDDSKKAPGFPTFDGDVRKPRPHHINGFSEQTFNKEWFRDITNKEAYLKPHLE
ncbi:hypothetical protein ACA910_007113 [Epithemia clementina (nom. ined.)]